MLKFYLPRPPRDHGNTASDIRVSIAGLIKRIQWFDQILFTFFSFLSFTAKKRSQNFDLRTFSVFLHPWNGKDAWNRFGTRIRISGCLSSRVLSSPGGKWQDNTKLQVTKTFWEGEFFPARLPSLKRMAFQTLKIDEHKPFNFCNFTKRSYLFRRVNLLFWVWPGVTWNPRWFFFWNPRRMAVSWSPSKQESGISYSWNGSEIFRFFPESHNHFFKNQFFCGVTTILG